MRDGLPRPMRGTLISGSLRRQLYSADGLHTKRIPNAVRPSGVHEVWHSILSG